MQSLNTKNSRKGLVGLANLGNTCYMNSALQCLSNCDRLTKYFLLDYKKAKINKSSAHLANAYYEVLENIWRYNNASFSPRIFKQVIGEYESMFNNYSQQDSHELLNYFLNILNTELNDAPNNATVSLSDSYDDESLCENKWKKLLNKEHSIIIDLFYDMYKSVLYCQNPDCLGTIKVFETFLSFQCPMNVNYVQCIFVYYDITSIPQQVQISIERDKTIGHFRAIVSEIFNVKPFSFIIANVQSNSIVELLNVTRDIREYKQLYCFQIDPQLTNDNQYKPDDVIPSKDIINILNKRTPIIVNEDNVNNMDEFENHLTDGNNKLDINNIRVILDIPFIYNIPSRIIYINNKWKNSELEQGIKQYLQPLIGSSNITITKVFTNKKKIVLNKSTDYDNIKPSEFQYPITNNYLFSQIKYQGKQEDLFKIEIQCPSIKTFRFNRQNIIYLPNNNPDILYLEQIIKQFSSKEALIGQWRCQRCNKYSQAKKTMSVYTCSHYLLIYLKRFRNNRKLTSLVIFPLKGLDMSQYSDRFNQSLTYDLIGVINHSGSLHGGHYYTYAKNILNSNWYCFNDRSVSKISERDIIQSNAVTLLYKRREIK